MTSPVWDIAPGQLTTRAELGSKYRGNQQAGIAHSASTPNIMVYSDAAETESPGYAFDGWDQTGEIYQYTGAGKHGDQKLSGDNKALLEHAQTGRSLRVFIAEGSVPGSQTRQQRYIGEFALDTDHPYVARCWLCC